MPTPDDFHEFLYADGHTGIDTAEMWITSHIWALTQVLEGRAKNPKAFPTYPRDATPQATARAIIARLLDAGWQPPDTACVTAPEDPQP